MKLFFQIILSLAFFNLSFAQPQVPCPEMDSVMAIIKEGPSELAALYDKQVLFDCGDFDDVDRILLFGNFLDNFMAANLEKYDSLTYTLMMKELKEVQASPNYRESYEISKTRMIVLNSIADTVLFDQNSSTFNDFFPTIEERNYVRTYVGKHQNDTLTFIEILEQYSSIDQVLVNDQAPPTQQKNQVQFFAFYDLKTALENGSYFERPILLYFSSYMDTISRKMEAEWFNESTINAIMNHMTVYQIMSDESMPMDPDDVKYFKKKYKKTFSTYGEKNAFIKDKEFKASSQPYFVLYTSTGKLIGKWTFAENKEAFKQFLLLSQR
jgi:hypothetical protein